ncbi:MAG: heme-binding protein [Oceanipulchritudo sp.]
MSAANGVEKAFERTAPGEIEIKVLPAGRLLENHGTGGSYFEQSGKLFGPLFSYIKAHNISMTTPVEASIEPGMMAFWVAPGQEERAEEASEGVKVRDVPERKVASIGARGGYSRENFEEAREKLLEWIAGQDGLATTGEPFAVYWNGPMTPWFLKTFEVMVEVE